MATTTTTTSTIPLENDSDTLPEPRRYVTDNNAEARSEFSQALPSTMDPLRGTRGSTVRLAYTLPSVPAHLDDQADIKAFQANLSVMKFIPPLLLPRGGASVWYIDHAPGSRVPMHRTVTVDIIVQIAGEIELELDSGKKRVLRPDDIAIQRSTVHTWHNPSNTQWARLVAITLQSEPVQVNGHILEEFFPGRPSA